MDASIYDKYISSLYYYIFTVATIGYGDISPVTSVEKLFACVNMLFACGISAYIIGSMGNIISSRYDAETNFKRKMDNLIQFLVYKKISPSLKIRIKKYLEHALEKKKEHKIDESEVLLLLNKNLRDEIALHINGQVLKSFVILCKYDELCILLTYVMKEETMNPNETIFHKDDLSNRVYFLTKGTVYICEEDTKIIFKELDRGMTFGELGFFSRRPRICAAETKSFINLSYLNIDDFKHYAYQIKLSSPIKFKNLRDEIEDVLTEIRKNNFFIIHSTCFLCTSSDHMAPDCDKLDKVDEYYKFKFTDKSHKTEYELEHIFQRIKVIKLQNKATLENQMDFSFSDDEEKFFDDSRFDDEEEENEEVEKYSMRVEHYKLIRIYLIKEFCLQQI
jgi:hypothetical protein